MRTGYPTIGSGYLVLLAFSAWYSCGPPVSHERLPEPEELKMAIAESFHVPLYDGDTIVYERVGICGNSSQEELNRYYEPMLDQEPYLSELQKHTRGKLLTSEEAHRMMSCIPFDSLNLRTPWDQFRHDKLLLSITGRVLTNRSVRIAVSFSRNEERNRDEYIYKYTGDTWQCSNCRD